MTGLRRILAIAWSCTYRVYKNPVNWIWTLGLPLLFGLVVGRFFASSGAFATPVTVVDEDGGPAAAAFIEALRATPFRVRAITRDEAAARVASGRLDVALVLPRGFSAAVAAGKPRLEVLRGPAYRPGVVERRARAIAAALAAGRPAPEVPVAVEPPRPAADPERFPHQRVIFGFYAMFALSALMQRASSLHEDRETGTLPRALVLGVPYAQLLAGHLLGLGLVGIVQAAVIFAVTAALGFPWLAAGPVAFALLVLATILAAGGLGVGLAGVARSPAQVRNASIVLSLALAMLGGAFWPLEIVPAAVRQVGRLSPVYWSMEALREAFVYQGSPAGLAVPLAILCLMGTLGIAIGVTGLRRYGR